MPGSVWKSHWSSKKQPEIKWNFYTSLFLTLLQNKQKQIWNSYRSNLWAIPWLILRNIEFKTLKKKTCDEAFRASFELPWCGCDQRVADFNKFLNIKTRSCYSYDTWMAFAFFQYKSFWIISNYWINPSRRTSVLIMTWRRGILRIETILMKNVLNVFAIFLSLFMISLFSTNVIFGELTILSERKGLTVFQNILLSVTCFSSRLT